MGANVGREHGTVRPAREVQRCTVAQPSSRPAYWDVAYEFRGVLHQVQMTQPPGPHITVNENGEPRA